VIDSTFAQLNCTIAKFDCAFALAHFKKASSAKTVGRNWCLIASKLRKPLESCPQQADSRMGL
jgi:hypothetical protein